MIRGPESPILLIIIMIEREMIQRIVEGILSDEVFIVGITVDKGNAIAVSVDSDKGINIDQCAEISRHIERNLDPDKIGSEDFSLEVSSPGLTQPLMVLRQYYKNIGRKVEVLTRNGEKHEGILKSVNTDGLKLEIREKEKVNGSVKVITKSVIYAFEQIKTVKLIISFK
jgi:ribosome maturation factor RimP